MAKMYTLKKETEIDGAPLGRERTPGPAGENARYWQNFFTSTAPMCIFFYVPSDITVLPIIIKCCHLVVNSFSRAFFVIFCCH